MIMYAVELQTADGTFRGRVAVDSGPMRLADLVPTAAELTQVLVASANRREERAGRSISCRAGCGACCRQLVPLSPPEVFFLADVLAGLPDSQRTAALERFAQIDAALEDAGMIDELLNPHSDDQPVLQIARAYFRLQLACPFLAEESCSIHAHRPVACREYNVTSPAAWCAEPYAHLIQKVPMPLPLSAPLARLTAELTNTLPTLVPLTLLPRWVAQHRELATRTWPGIELFERFIKLFSREDSLVARPLTSQTAPGDG
jgi:Fe-S-cluster containining protein